ncbi:MAG: anti-sigma factor [Mucilaginibacter sp.]|nr:anti-sigma factor [Mucilaginibacter sp.]
MCFIDKMNKGTELINKYISGNCTEEEKRLVERFYLEQFKQLPLPDGIHVDENIKVSAWSNINAHMPPRQKIKRINYLLRYAVAASLILATCTWLYIAEKRKLTAQNNELVRQKNKITPGRNTAILTLANGTSVNLGKGASGNVAQQQGVTVLKNNGQLTYQVSPQDLKNTAAAVQYNTIETPLGGQYRLVLADGTKVWLNASSSLKYPTSFTNLKERLVVLTGEGYFEVKHDRSKAFRVRSSGQVTEDIGTSFNISSYADDPETKTTLITGVVKIFPIINKIIDERQTGTLVVADQLARVKANGSITVQQVDTEESIAWKNNEFMFNDEPLESIMKKVSRWYNVSVQYQDGNIRESKFGGTISRFENIADVLHMLELTGKVHFKIQERRIIVSK